MKPLLLLALALVTPIVAPLAANAQMADEPAPTEAERAVAAQLDEDMKAFNRGDFKGYLADFARTVSYNELTVSRDQMVDLNAELKGSFPNLKMRYTSPVRVKAVSPDEAWATTVSDFTGSTKNYDGSGFPATYHEVGRLSALYKLDNGKWTTDTVQVGFNDSYIDIGENFGTLGFTTLTDLIGVGQPYRFRLWVGHEYMASTAETYAYAVVPLSTVLDKAGSEKIFGALKFAAVPHAGLDLEMRAPEKAGTYVHLLVLNRTGRTRYGESPIGQKVYTRVVRVEE